MQLRQRAELVEEQIVRAILSWSGVGAQQKARPDYTVCTGRRTNEGLAIN